MLRSIPVVFAALVLIATPVRSFQHSPGLRSIAAQREFHLGVAVAVSALNDEPMYRETIAREFNMIVAENAFKFEALHPDRDRYFFTDADALVDFALRNNMRVRGHTLVWHAQLPKWVTEASWSRSEAIELMKDHIQTVMGRYKGRVAEWDVVNEAVDEQQSDGLRQDSFWHRNIGPDYIRMAFQMAREADPDAVLYYNDFSNEDKGKRSNVVFRLMSELKQQGVPIDGIGWQMHVGAGFKVKAAHRENAQRLADLGLELSITELDMRIKLPAEADSERQQAESYRDVTVFCLTQPSCRALVLWGLTDKHSWIPSVFNGEGDALIFDASYRPKLAYERMREALEDALRGAPKITSASFKEDVLVVNGENFEKGSALVIEGRVAKLSSTQPPASLTLKNAGRFVPANKVSRLQVKNRNGKLSVERRFTREDGLLKGIGVEHSVPEE